MIWSLPKIFIVAIVYAYGVQRNNRENGIELHLHLYNVQYMQMN